MSAILYPWEGTHGAVGVRLRARLAHWPDDVSDGPRHFLRRVAHGGAAVPLCFPGRRRGEPRRHRAAIVLAAVSGLTVIVFVWLDMGGLRTLFDAILMVLFLYGVLSLLLALVTSVLLPLSACLLPSAPEEVLAAGSSPDVGPTERYADWWACDVFADQLIGRPAEYVAAVCVGIPHRRHQFVRQRRHRP